MQLRAWAFSARSRLRSAIGPAVIGLATGIFGAFGALSIVGGAMGFKKAGSKASLWAGGLSGAGLLGAAYCIATGAVTTGLLLGGGISLLLGGRFLPAYLRTKKLMPQGAMALFSALGLIISVLGYYSL